MIVIIYELRSPLLLRCALAGKRKFISRDWACIPVRVMATLRVEGPLSVGEEVVLRFYPAVKKLLEEIRSRGWEYHIEGVVGIARVALDPRKLRFRLRHISPRKEKGEKESTYAIEAELGKAPPEILEVENIKRFEVAVSTEHAERCVRVDPLNRVITYVEDVLWEGFRLGVERTPQRLSEAREVYEVVKFFLNNGYKFEDKYVARRYEDLVNLFEKKYTFTLTLDLTMEREDVVPRWDRLREELLEFFRKRGISMRLKELLDDRDAQ